MTRMFRIVLVALVGVGQMVVVPRAQTEANSAEQFGPRSTPPLNLPGPIPRTADNKPDLRGGWNSPPLFNSHILEEHVGGFGIQPGRSVVVDPPDGIIPYQPWALKQRNENRRSENAYLDNEGRCILSGVPRVMLFTYELQYAGNDIVMFFGYGHMTRIVHMDRRTHLPDGIRLWMGDSIGWWEGDTLVVDTTNFNGKPWMVLGGDLSSDELHIVERFTMSDANTLQWRATLTDPKAYTRPWTMQWNNPYRRGVPLEIENDECQEGNDVLAHLKNNYDNARKAPASATPTFTTRAAELAKAGQGAFTGVWNINVGKSGRAGRDSSFSSQLVIGQTPAEVHLESHSERQDTIAVIYKLDGSPMTIPGLGGVTMTTKGSVEGERLVLQADRKFSTPAGDIVVTMRDVYTHDGIGLSVTRTQIIDGEQQTATAFYDKSQR